MLHSLLIFRLQLLELRRILALLFLLCLASTPDAVCNECATAQEKRCHDDDLVVVVVVVVGVILVVVEEQMVKLQLGVGWRCSMDNIKLVDGRVSSGRLCRTRSMR